MPIVPTLAPCSVGEDCACRLGRHAVRERVTGPGFAVVVVRCHAHRQAFTLYPPGYAPYARQPVAPVAPDGGRQRADCREDQAERFRGTLFEPALDAAQGRAWPREHEYASDHWWNTQRRLLCLARAVLGLSPTADSELRHQLAEVLAIPALVLEEHALALLAAGAGYRERGVAVAAVLRRLKPTPMLADRLLEAGRLAGCWGMQYRWMSDVGALRCCPFRAAGTTGTAAPRRPP